MVELAKEEEELASRRAEEKHAEYIAQREKAKQERERKKLEAMERSRLKKEQENNFPEANTTSLVDEVSNAEGKQDITDTAEESEDVENPSGKDDVFRSYRSSTRNKVYVK